MPSTSGKAQIGLPPFFFWFKPRDGKSGVKQQIPNSKTESPPSFLVGCSVLERSYKASSTIFSDYNFPHSPAVSRDSVREYIPQLSCSSDASPPPQSHAVMKENRQNWGLKCEFPFKSQISSACRSHQLSFQVLSIQHLETEELVVSHPSHWKIQNLLSLPLNPRGFKGLQKSCPDELSKAGSHLHSSHKPYPLHPTASRNIFFQVEEQAWASVPFPTGP